MNRKFRTIIATAAAAVFISTGLAACGSNDEVETLTPEQTEQINDDVQQQVDQAEQEAQDAMDEGQQQLEDAQDQIEQSTP